MSHAEAVSHICSNLYLHFWSWHQTDVRCSKNLTNMKHDHQRTYSPPPFPQCPSSTVSYLIANYPLGHPRITLGAERERERYHHYHPHAARLLIGWPLNLGAESLLRSHVGPDISAARREHSTLPDNYGHGWFLRANIIRSGMRD